MAYNEGKWQASLWPHSWKLALIPKICPLIWKCIFFSFVALKHAAESTVRVKVIQFCCSSHYFHTVSHIAVHFITQMPASQGNTVISHLFHINWFILGLGHLSIIKHLMLLWYDWKWGYKIPLETVRCLAPQFIKETIPN